MAAPANALSSILKTVYDDRFDKNALARTSKLMALISHEEDFFGATFDWSVAYAGLGGRSHSITAAEANDVNGAYARFSVAPRHDYDTRIMNGALVRAALKGGVTTQFLDYLTQEMQLAQDTLNQNLARGAYASETGRRGIRGTLAGNILTLSVPSDALYWNIGDKVKAGALDGGPLRAGTGAVLTGVDTANGTLTSTTWANITGFLDGDSMYVEGDWNASYHGLSSYCPAVAPAPGDAVFGAGVDRSVNPEALAGVRLNTTGANIETVLITSMAYLKTRPGGAYKNAKIMCSEIDFAGIQVAKEGSRFIDDSGPYEMGIEAFKVGTNTVVPDVFCPQGTFFVIGEGAFELHSISGVSIDENDGLSMRKAAGDNYTLAALIDGNFICPKPHGLARGPWPAQ
jgi:hypothetical protein